MVGYQARGKKQNCPDGNPELRIGDGRGDGVSAARGSERGRPDRRDSAWAITGVDSVKSTIENTASISKTLLHRYLALSHRAKFYCEAGYSQVAGHDSDCPNIRVKLSQSSG
jgi:hypothetical protein